MKIVDFGAFVNFFGAKDGLVHISPARRAARRQGHRRRQGRRQGEGQAPRLRRARQGPPVDEGRRPGDRRGPGEEAEAASPRPPRASDPPAPTSLAFVEPLPPPAGGVFRCGMRLAPTRQKGAEPPLPSVGEGAGVRARNRRRRVRASSERGLRERRMQAPPRGPSLCPLPSRKGFPAPVMKRSRLPGGGGPSRPRHRRVIRRVSAAGEKALCFLSQRVSA